MVLSNWGTLQQYGAATSACMSMFIIGNWLSWPSSAVKDLLAGETQLTLDTDQVSWVVALLDFGNIISPLPASSVANKLGRKLPIITLSFFFLLSWLLVIFGNNVYYLFIARLIVGITTGLAFTVVPIYLGEIASTNIRGSVGTIFSGLMSCGVLYELCVGPFVTYEWLNIISAPFPILFFLMFFKLPETPYFLIMKGKIEDAQESLAWFRDLPKDSFILQQELKNISVSVEEDMKQSGSFRDLINFKSNRNAMLISVTLAVLQRLSGAPCIISYSTVTLPSTGGYFSPQVYMIFFGVTMILGQGVCSLLVDRWGRRPLLIISSFGCGLSTAISGLFYWLNESSDMTSYNWVPYVCLILFGIIFSMGVGTVPPVIMVELFPSEVRSYAASIMAICYALSSFISTKAYLYVQLQLGTYFIFMFFTIMSTVCVFFTFIFVFETKGKTFSEIQSILQHM